MTVRRLRMHLDRTRQKRTVLHMLILSGVIRPSHTGLRYLTLFKEAHEPTTDSQNSPLRPTHLHRVFSLLHQWITQLLSREPRYIQPSTVEPRRATAWRICLRSLNKSECESSLVPLP